VGEVVDPMSRWGSRDAEPWLSGRQAVVLSSEVVLDWEIEEVGGVVDPVSRWGSRDAEPWLSGRQAVVPSSEVALDWEIEEAVVNKREVSEVSLPWVTELLITSVAVFSPVAVKAAVNKVAVNMLMLHQIWTCDKHRTDLFFLVPFFFLSPKSTNSPRSARSFLFCAMLASRLRSYSDLPLDLPLPFEIID
jgi:hypothetical protein